MKSGSVFEYYWVRTYWVSHMGLTKTMPEFGKYPFHRPGKNAERWVSIVLQLFIIHYMSWLFLW
ncbi:hypothetical protein A3860_31950 [Niastella vici]|uniref:Uncharacterized protein n=1 Tax=Niastella vici TaxID=1703345 RepID=A0A1V9FT80_9BACT|nr:hypothetical protein A3860_31950 [Niastella vici]